MKYTLDNTCVGFIQFEDSIYCNCQTGFILYSHVHMYLVSDIGMHSFHILCCALKLNGTSGFWHCVSVRQSVRPFVKYDFSRMRAIVMSDWNQEVLWFGVIIQIEYLFSISYHIHMLFSDERIPSTQQLISMRCHLNVSPIYSCKLFLPLSTILIKFVPHITDVIRVL